MQNIETPAPAAVQAGPVEDTPARPKIDYTRLTLGEVDKIETLSGLPATALDDDTAPKGRLLAALVFVASRRYAEPKSWDECMAMPMVDATEYLGIDDEDDEGNVGTEALDEDEGPKD